MATSTANGQVFSMAEHVINSRRANLKSLSVNDILFFNSAFKDKNKMFKVGRKVSHFYLTVMFDTFTASMIWPK